MLVSLKGPDEVGVGCAERSWNLELIATAGITDRRRKTSFLLPSGILQVSPIGRTYKEASWEIY